MHYLLLNKNVYIIQLVFILMRRIKLKFA